jgi:cystathionine beta-lyase
MAKSDTGMGMNTRLAHMGNDPRDYFGFVNPPVVHASTVLYPDAATLVSRNQKYTYGTRGTPTTDALTGAINELEGSAGTILVPSGLAAVTVPLLAFASAGDHMLIVDSVYHPTRHFADTMLRRLGVEVVYYDPRVGAGIAALIKPNTSIVFTESPASNTFEVQDIPAIARAAHAAGAIVMMDNTWATPLFFRPLDHGVDVSIHAATKYPGGGQKEQHAFLDALKIFGLGYSWAGYESLAVPVFLGDRIIAKGPYQGPLIRLQIGLENVEDLMADLARGLGAAAAA